MNPGRIAATVTDRVSDQVLKELLQLKFVDTYAREGCAGNLGASFEDRSLQVRKRFLEDVARFQVFCGLIFFGRYLRIRSQVAQKRFHP